MKKRFLMILSLILLVFLSLSANAQEINAGDTALLSAASALVMLMTPASGFVGPISSIIIGLVAGVLSNYVASWRATRTRIDDTLDVFACHGVAGIWGALATGLFASAAVNKVNGLFFGNPMQLAYQAIAVAVVALYAFIGSYLLLKGLSFVMNIRVSKEEEDIGLDKSQHQEEAYT